MQLNIPRSNKNQCVWNAAIDKTQLAADLVVSGCLAPYLDRVAINARCDCCLDDHTPLITMTVMVRPIGQWPTGDIRALRQSGIAVHRQMFTHLRKACRRTLKEGTPISILYMVLKNIILSLNLAFRKASSRKSKRSFAIHHGSQLTT